MVSMQRAVPLTRLVRLCLVVSIGCCLGLPSLAQEKTVESGGGVKTSTLLSSGFEIVAANHLQHSIVLTLQRGNRAFFCEMNFSGATIQCVEIK